MAYTVVFARIRLTFIYGDVTELAGEATVACALRFAGYFFTCAVIAWIERATCHFFFTIRTRKSVRAYAVIAGDKIFTRCIIFAHVIFTVVYVGLTTFARKSQLTHANT